MCSLFLTSTTADDAFTISEQVRMYVLHICSWTQEEEVLCGSGTVIEWHVHNTFIFCMSQIIGYISINIVKIASNRECLVSHFSQMIDLLCLFHLLLHGHVLLMRSVNYYLC